MSSLLVLSACSGSDSDADSTRGSEGAACVDGTNCKNGLFCFVTSNDPNAGTCQKPPAACNGAMACDCLDELDPQCATSKSCLGLSGDYVVGCGQSAPRQAGETCSSVVNCDTGLYCMIPGAGHAGTCQTLPSECAGSPSCACLSGVQDSCPKGSGCLVVGNVATINCH